MKKQIFIFMLFGCSFVPVESGENFNTKETNTFRQIRECGICRLNLRELDTGQVCQTNCCKKFMCQHCVERMEKEAKDLYRNLHDSSWRKQFAASSDFVGWPQEREHAQCPYCRMYPLKVEFLSRATDTIQQTGSSVQVPRLQECRICLDEKVVQEFVALQCGHAFCNACLEHMVDLAIKERSTTQLRCSDTQCAAQMTEQDIRAITNLQEKIDAIAAIQTQEWIVQQPNAKHCPTADCPYVFLNEDAKKETITCPQCNKQYCSNCLLLHNPTMSCDAVEAERIVANVNQEWMQKNTKPCPGCGVRIEKNEGCLFIRCINCKRGFCFNCDGTHHVSTCNNPPVNLPPQGVPARDRQQQRAQQAEVEARVLAERRARAEAAQRQAAERALEQERARQEEVARRQALVDQRVREQEAQIIVLPARRSPYAAIINWKPGIVASPSILARDSRLRAKQERMPIWVTIAFNMEASSDFVNRFFDYLSALTHTRLVPRNHGKNRNHFIITVDRSMRRETFIELLDRANHHFDV
ncbi:hypothetical protein KAU11_00595 [Candidatus Babeliales bacterium]|nr:hypothetical protein [Candidatus Babeliales bacterium]